MLVATRPNVLSARWSALKNIKKPGLARLFYFLRLILARLATSSPTWHHALRQSRNCTPNPYRLTSIANPPQNSYSYPITKQHCG